MTRTQKAGAALLVIVVAAIAAAPILAPNPPSQQHAGFAWAPPMPPRLLDAGSVRAPFVYPLRLTDRLSRTYTLDTGAPAAITFFAGGRVASTPGTTWLPLGADPNGRDVFARLLDGGRRSLGVAGIAVLLTLLIGSLVGAVAGFSGGTLDTVLTAVSDFVLVLPVLYAVVTLRAALPLVLEPATIFWTMVMVMALASWPAPARVVRAIVASERTKGYAEAAHAAGAGPLRILLRHVLPAAARQIGLQGLLLFPAFIFAEATLSFLGFGFAEPTSSWGVMLQDAAAISAMTEAPWLLAPAVVIVITVAAIHMLGTDAETQS